MGENKVHLFFESAIPLDHLRGEGDFLLPFSGSLDAVFSAPLLGDDVLFPVLLQLSSLLSPTKSTLSPAQPFLNLSATFGFSP